MFQYRGSKNRSGQPSFIPGIPARDLSDSEAKKLVAALNLSPEQLKDLGSWEKALTRNGLYKQVSGKPKDKEAR